VVIATKFGNVIDTQRRVLAGTDASQEFIRQSLDASLERLGTEYIDLYQFHIWGYPVDEALPVRDRLEELTSEGKIRGYAWSTDVLESVEMFAPGPNCTAVQNELNLFRCDDAMLQLCERENLAAVNRSPLAMGVLTGNSRTPALPRRMFAPMCPGISGSKMESPPQPVCRCWRQSGIF
jgi:aryl-alcohol dehydrogenase-like predicted oxidoreductase